MNKRPILHMSVCCQGSSKIKKELWKKISVFSHKYNNDPDEPLIDISMDSLDSQEEKRLLLSASCQHMITAEIKKAIKNTDNLYMAFSTLTCFSMESLHEKSENWLLISFTLSKTEQDAYNIQSTTVRHRY